MNLINQTKARSSHAFDDLSYIVTEFKARASSIEILPMTQSMKM